MLSLQNCKKAEPDPVKPGGGTTTPGSSTTATASGPVINQSITVASISSTSAVITAVIDGNGGEAITTHTMNIVESATNKQAKSITLGATSGPFPLTVTQAITGLTADTKYKAIFVVTNKVSSTQKETEFTTTTTAKITLSTLTQSYVESVTDYSIKFSAVAINYQQGAKLTATGFCYSDTKSQPTTDDAKVSGAVSSTGATSTFFEAELTGLKASTPYTIRAYAVVDGVTYYSNALQVSTIAKASNATVTRRANFPGIAHSQAIQFSLGGKFYMGANQRAANGSTSPNFWFEYDPATDKWTQKGNITISSGAYAGGRSGITYVANGKGYFGFSTDFTANTELWEYDPATDKWTRIATGLTNPLRSPNLLLHSQVQVGTKVYLIGQELGTTSAIRFYEYDIASRTFTQKAVPAGTNSSGNKLVAFNNTVYAHLGTAFAEYNAASNIWTTKKQVPASSASNSYGIQLISAVGGKLYGLGQEIFEYNPSDDSWKSILKLSAADRPTENNSLSFERPDRLFIGASVGLYSDKWYEFKP
ncbi:hypothetical protein GCM10028807_41980 [Spirosoma daeguense]